MFAQLTDFVAATQDLLSPSVISLRPNAREALSGSVSSSAGVMYSSLPSKLPDGLADVGAMMLLPADFRWMTKLDSALTKLPMLGREGRMILCRSIEEWVNDPGMVAEVGEALSPFLMREPRW